jgi:light-regulated signal transduction histidine kinase (bacteriophytochrome)
MSIEAMKEALDTLEKAYVLQEIDDLIPKDAPIKQTVNRLRQAIEQAESITQITQNHYSNQIQWAGLTQQDIDIAFDDTQEGGGFNEFARAIEQTLRSKNT